MTVEPLAVDAAEAARIIGVSRWHVYRLIDAGLLAKVPHMGRRVLIARAEIERFVANGVTREDGAA